MAFTTDDAKKAMPDCSEAEASAWVKTATKAVEDGKTQEQAADLATKFTKNMIAPKEAAPELPLEPAAEPLPAPAKESNRQHHMKALGLSEACSEAADDAARGAYVQASILAIMADESDEPDELAQLQAAYDAMAAWIKSEMATIGTPEDVVEPQPYAEWEAKGHGYAGSVAPMVTDAAELREAAIRRDGTAQIKIISDGWGTSGYYSDELLETQGPAAFKSGCKMYWDHPTKTEESERPERSLRDLAAVLVSDARYVKDGPKGAGLYADAKVYDSYQAPLNEMAADIGVSIRALGTFHNGSAAGRQGRIIDSLSEVHSVDFVTLPGRGGEVLELFEAARRNASAPTTPPPEESMDLKEALAERDAAQADSARLQEALVLREAKDVVAEELKSSDVADITKTRLHESLAKNPPIKDGTLDTDALKTQVKEAVAEEIKYLATLGVGNGKPKGMGVGATRTQEAHDPEFEKDLEAVFGRLGLSEAAAKTAAAGRR